MPRINLNDWDLDENSPRSHRQQRKLQPRPKRDIQQVVASLAEEAHTEAGFNFSYQASRHEAEWIANSLGQFYDQRWISDVLRLIKGGKEASVYLCAAPSHLGADYIAAKVYRPRRYRQMKDDSIYREGRQHLDADGRPITEDGMLHAIYKRTGYGRELMQESWIEHEFKTMQILHTAGVAVPEPYVSGNNAILMAYIGSPEMPAHTLNEVNLPVDEAKELFRRVLNDIDRMLAQGRIHGDLSAYNILYWEGEIAIIDFPQAVSPLENRSAYQLFERDVTKVCEYFSRQGLPANPRRLAQELWTRHGYRLAPEVHPKDLDGQDEADRRYWEKYK